MEAAIYSLGDPTTRLAARKARAKGQARDRCRLRSRSRSRGLDFDFQQMAGAGWPVRDFESVFTTVYQYEVRGGWKLQPNFQYFIHPGGGATGPLGSNPGKLLKDVTVFGLRTVLKF